MRQLEQMRMTGESGKYPEQYTSEWRNYMYSGIDAKVAVSHCREGKKGYGVRFEKTTLGWKYDWAFKLSADRAKSEGYGSTKIVGNIYPDNEYPGCPYCGAKSFIVCGSCGKLNCNNTEEKIFTCGWCGAKGELIDYAGDGINSSGDV